MEVNNNIKEAINNNSLVIFVGAGLSSKFDLPTWNKLVEDVIDKIDIVKYKPLVDLMKDQLMEPIEVLGKIKTEHTTIKKYILNNFEINSNDLDLHKEIINLTGQIITTNYDNAFEQASNGSLKPSTHTSTFNISEINKSGKDYLFKIHGTYSEPDNCVIFKEDYQKLYKQESATTAKLKTIFSEKTILFLGFGFNDPDINLIFENLDHIFENNSKHYILTKEPEGFKDFKFLESIKIADYGDIDQYIAECNKIKGTLKVNSKSNIQTNTNNNSFIDEYLFTRLDNSLTMFNGQTVCWIDPILSVSNLISTNYVENAKSKVDLGVIIDTPKSTMIKSPPQFGLTCLSHYLIKKAWDKNKVWVYLDAEKIKKHALEKEVLNELKQTFHSDQISGIDCIILDSWKSNMHGGMKLLKTLSSLYKDIPIIVMQTIDPNNFLQEAEEESIQRKFDVKHLLALPKNEIRKIVTSYNDITYIGEDDKVVNKIVKDLEVLNIHRTPMNCLTLLKVSERYFDEKTINRSDMLHKVLYILFDLSDVPNYQTKPDLKDCEFVLGIYCEIMMRNEKYYFSKDQFISSSQEVCKNNFIDLDINALFDILYSNGIIIDRNGQFTFRATYWMFYFAANRMYADPEFTSYIFDSEKYVNYPELIEFYTGIDRRRTDALIILKDNLEATCVDVLAKLGLPEHIDPYVKVEWNPSQESIERARQEIGEDVQTSKLPTEIKDQHSDSNQDQLKPYSQGIRTILQEYSLAILMRKITASSRALRNSDYAKPEVKKELLNSIVKGYEQVAKALMVLTPELAINGSAAFEGQSFNLDGDFGDTIDKRMNKILQTIPSNVVKFFKDDIDSEKLGPLLIARIESEKTPLTKHVLMLLIMRIRPSNWRKTIEGYIKSLAKNSFYLFDLMGQMRFLFFYDYVSDSEASDMKILIQNGYSKHEFGKQKPSKTEFIELSRTVLKKPAEK